MRTQTVGHLEQDTPCGQTKQDTPCGRMEFHVSRKSRDFYGFDLELFSSSGNVVFPNFFAARVFAQKMNTKRDLARFPERAVQASQLNAMGLIDELLHVMLNRYKQDHNPKLMAQTLASLEARIGAECVDKTLKTFCDEFPPVRVYRRDLDLETYYKGATDGVPNKEILLEELILLHLANANPAFSPFLELFDDQRLEFETCYPALVPAVEQFFDTQPGFAAVGGLKLYRALRMPALSHPYSLEAQLEFLLGRFSGALGTFAVRLLSSVDLIREEGKWFLAQNAAPGPGGFGGEVHVQTLSKQLLEFEPENFTVDREWMPRLVLMAKNAFVWLDQLSKLYQRPIRTLADVPDEELDALAAWGVTGLWLIGLWERSAASKDIKQRMGNADAVASAYSLFDYAIANDLGGESALENLTARAWARGIRMASDMVPNHMGIDGRWVLQHPDWFVQLPYPPFPSYTFGGPNLSNDDRVGIFLEDHYWDRSDAAVVFKRMDKWTGAETFIYHGNDGTSLPWNDTAQLDYLKAEVREAIIQTILHVARQFPVIRFDAAMTLAKKHIQRLWYPEPGSGAPAIASRGEFGLSKADFDRMMPEEFWREVVDRCAVEAPDTLLLAEAFWMMEGYFVRTLGMHRVYNSAFMNMLRDEKNGEYRTIMKNTLEFEPEILKRYVNFLNNPDEKTAVEQFGKGDKYFGAAVLCATLPGLPMLGHGQVEGYAEKYGMEYRRAYYDESPDDGLIEYHRQQLFPLLKKRYLFADVENFVLYDFHTIEGTVSDDVFAYSNRFGDERALIVYHNKYGTTRGTVRQGDRGKHRGASLVDGLGLNPDGAHYAIYRDLVSGLEYIRSSKDIAHDGLQLELGAFERRVLMDWREVYDWDGRYWRITQMLGPRGVPSIEDASRDLVLEPILGPWREIVNPSVFRNLIEAGTSKSGTKSSARLMGELEAKLKGFADGVESVTTKNLDGAAFATKVRSDLESALKLPKNLNSSDDAAHWGGVFGWVLTRRLGELDGNASPERSRSLIDEWRLGPTMEHTLRELGVSSDVASRTVGHAKVLVAHQAALEGAPSTVMLENWFNDAEAQSVLGVNRYRETLWFNRESFEALLESAAPIVMAAGGPGAARTKAWTTQLDGFRALGESSNYRVEELLLGLRSTPKAKRLSVSKSSASKPNASKPSAPKPSASKPSARKKKAAPIKSTNTVPDAVSEVSKNTVPDGVPVNTLKKAPAVKASGAKTTKPKTTAPIKPKKTVQDSVVAPKPKRVPTTKASSASKSSGTTKPKSPKRATTVAVKPKKIVQKAVAAEPKPAVKKASGKTTKTATTKTATAKTVAPKKAPVAKPQPKVSSKTATATVGKKVTTAKPTGAKKPAAKPAPKDDLTRIEGIGPKMAAALEAAGISSFATLAKSKEDSLREALEKDGLKFAPSLGTWAKQAALLGRGDEVGFKKLTDQLVAGRQTKKNTR